MTVWKAYKLSLCLWAIASAAANATNSTELEAIKDSVPDGIFFRISGNGLDQPSYILGTLHTVPGDFVHHIPYFEQAVKSVRQFIFESDISQKLRQGDFISQCDSAMLAHLLAKNDSLYHYDNPDSLHNPYIEDLEPSLYNLVRTTLTDTFGIHGFYKHSAIENAKQLRLHYFASIKEITSELGVPLQQAEVPIDLYIADNIARPQGADIAELDTTWVIQNLDSTLVKFLEEDKAGIHDRKFFSTQFLTNSVFYYLLLRIATRQYCASYFRHEGQNMLKPMNEQMERKIFSERNALWMHRLPTLLHREPSMVVVGLGHLHDRSSTPGMLSSLISLGYTIEALASPSEN